MKGLLRRIRRWLKNLFGWLFGARTTQTSLFSSGRKGRSQLDSPTELTDTEYEFLFMQLMEGIGHGWHEGRIVKFFDKLGEQGKPKVWVAFIERFGEKLLASPSPNQMLATRMIRLGELAQTVPQLVSIGEISYRVGRQVHSKTTQDMIWDYEGPDMEAASSNIPQIQFIQPQDASELSGQNAGVETLTLEELLTRLQEDAGLAQVLAEQMGLDAANPQEIIDLLIQQFQSFQTQMGQEKNPETVEEWFEQGLKQAGVADWEGAIASWDQALELNSNLAQAWHNRGRALAHLGRLTEALHSMDQAMELDPEDYQIWNSRGTVLFSLQQWQECLYCWEKVIELKGDYYQAWYNRGFTLENLNRIEEAKASYQKALELEPDFDLAQAKLMDLSAMNNEQ